MKNDPQNILRHREILHIALILSDGRVHLGIYFCAKKWTGNLGQMKIAAREIGSCWQHGQINGVWNMVAGLEHWG